MVLDVVFLYLSVALGDADRDRAIARSIREGDLDVFRTFYENQRATLAGFLRKRHVPDDVADDIIQNAFITIWERREEIDENKSLRSFLYRISYTRALNHFRDTAKFAGNAGPEESLPMALAADREPGPDQQTDHVIVRQALGRILDGLPEKRRTVFELCFLQEMTYREAADVLEISIKTVENHMALALKAVREGLEKYR